MRVLQYRMLIWAETMSGGLEQLLVQSSRFQTRLERSHDHQPACSETLEQMMGKRAEVLLWYRSCLKELGHEVGTPLQFKRSPLCSRATNCPRVLRQRIISGSRRS